MTADASELTQDDWLSLGRRVAKGAHAVLDAKPLPADRAETTGRGAGGDESLVIDTAVEDVAIAELERLERPLNVITEERGELELHGGGPIQVVIDPIDGSRNARSGLPYHALSIAVASGTTMSSIEFAFVHSFGMRCDWWANRGGGSFFDGRRLELDPETELTVLALESTSPARVAAHAQALTETGAQRLRAIGSIALSMCRVASGGFDGLVTLGESRSVDAAAAQLIVREAGGSVAFPDAPGPIDDAGLDLGMRSRVIAAPSDEIARRLVAVGG